VELLHRRVRERAHQLVDATRVEAALAALRRRPRASPAELECRGERGRPRLAHAEPTKLGDREPRQLGHGPTRRTAGAEHREELGVGERPGPVHQEPLADQVLDHGALPYACACSAARRIVGGRATTFAGAGGRFSAARRQPTSGGFSLEHGPSARYSGPLARAPALVRLLLRRQSSNVRSRRRRNRRFEVSRSTEDVLDLPHGRAHLLGDLADEVGGRTVSAGPDWRMTARWRASVEPPTALSAIISGETPRTKVRRRGRAGAAGRGFAVVAEEVRSIAKRAKEAAAKTEALIKDSVTHADAGAATASVLEAKLRDIL
jgi:hypothetical protein